MMIMLFQAISFPLGNIRAESSQDRQGHDIITKHVGMNSVRPDHPAPSASRDVILSAVHDPIHIDDPDSVRGRFVTNGVVAGVHAVIERSIPSAPRINWFNT